MCCNNCEGYSGHISWKRKLQDDVDRAYDCFRNNFAKKFGEERPLLPPQLFSKYRAVFRAMLYPHMYTPEIQRERFEDRFNIKNPGASPSEIKEFIKNSGELIRAAADKESKIGCPLDIGNRRHLDEKLAQTHKLLEERFDLVGYTQTYGTDSIQGCIMAAWPVSSFLFRDSEGKVYSWHQSKILHLTTREGPWSPDEIMAGNLSGPCYQRDIAESLGIQEEEFAALCLELPENNVIVELGGLSVYRPLVVKTLLKSERTWEDYLQAGEKIKKHHGALIFSQKTGLRGLHNPLLLEKMFEVVYPTPLEKGVDPRYVTFADGRFGFDGLIHVRNSELIGNVVVPYLVGSPNISDKPRCDTSR